MKIIIKILSLSLVATFLLLIGCETTLVIEDHPSNRCQLVKTEIQRFNKGLDSKLVALKFKKIRSSPFIFYRGTNHLYWMDLYHPRGFLKSNANGILIDQKLSIFDNEKTRTWLQADMHVHNFGFWQNRDGNVVFDLNDFDEVVVGPYFGDLLRLAASIYLVEFNFEIGEKKLKKVASQLAHSYLKEVVKQKRPKPGTTIFDRDHYLFHQNPKKNILGKFLKKLSKKKNLYKKTLDKYTGISKDGAREFKKGKNSSFRSLPNPIVTELKAGLNSGYLLSLKKKPKEFKVLEIVEKLGSGTGSIGMRRFYALISMKSSSKEDSYVILVIKQQANQPTPSFFIKDSSQFKTSGERVSKGLQGLIHRGSRWSGFFTALVNGSRLNFSVIDRTPYEKSFALEKLAKSKGELLVLADIWGRVLAMAHSRANDSHFNKTFAKLVKNREKDFVAAVTLFAASYSKQVKEDWRYFISDCQ